MAVWDDIAKQILKQVNSKAYQKVRYDFAKGSNTLNQKNPSSKITGKKAAERSRAAVPKSSSGSKQSKRKGTSTTGRPVGRIAKTKPERKRRDFVSTKNTGITKNDSERRAASRETNKFFRIKGESGSVSSKPSGSEMPVNLKGSIIKVPPKATLRSPKPSRESFESDQMKRDFMSDLNAGLGRKAPSKKKNVEPMAKGTKPAKKQVAKKPASKANTRSTKSSSRPTGRYRTGDK